MKIAFRRQVTAALCALAIAGCGLFSTRDPEQPVGEVPRFTPNLPDSVILNLETGFRYKTFGTARIAETFSEKLGFILDPSDAQQLGVDSLDKTQVGIGVDGFFALRVNTDSVLIDVKLKESTSEDNSGNHWTFFSVPYKVIIFRNNSMRPENRAIRDSLGGTIDLTFRRLDGGNYEIARWVDRLGTAAPSTLGYYIAFFSGAG